ncbi:hypothetical protein GCM10010174_70510 [Kutzneria viridogrisea]|uniref:Uncharacterized protein n=2 Tax=Kutzneria TaxID=43356 RepID=W5WBB3_9PSEU|nr:hypothetical protein [Kutzneria albida]AHH98458.1 hypothetical protein KALB_5096 [Kutzneria albida DSM 43870]MBA8923957.1 hypothetical protein [Kutzneria viridogrisea]
MSEAMRNEPVVDETVDSGANPAGEISVQPRTRAGLRATALLGLTVGMGAFAAVTANVSTVVSIVGHPQA